MASAFVVDTDQLADIVAEMAKFDSDAEATCAEVDRIVSELHSAWTGDAADAQRAAHDRWTAGAQQMRTAVADLQAAGNIAHGNYTGAAEVNQAMWS